MQVCSLAYVTTVVGVHRADVCVAVTLVQQNAAYLTMQYGSHVSGKAPLLALGHVSLRGAATNAANSDPLDVLRSASRREESTLHVFESGKSRMAVIPSGADPAVVETCRRVYPYAVFADVRAMVEKGCGDVAIAVRSSRLQPYITVSHA